MAKTFDQFVNVEVARSPTVKPPVLGGSARAIVRRVDITPRLGVGLAGYGVADAHRFARGWTGPLYATLVLMDDGAGGRSAIVALDLHAATRYLAERIALRSATVGVPIDRLLFCAAHNHASPANGYGSHLYDGITGPVAGFDPTYPDAIGRQIGDRIVSMAATLAEPGRPASTLTYMESTVWGPIWQRALLANLANEGEVAKLGPEQVAARARATGARIAGEEPTFDTTPAANDPRFSAVDARVRCLVWRTPGDVTGVVAFMAVTPTSVDRKARLIGADGFGWAARFAEHRLAPEQVQVAVMGSGLGDTFLIDPELGFAAFEQKRREAISWKTLPSHLRKCTDLGARLGDAIVRALHEPAVQQLRPAPPGVHFREADLAGTSVQIAGPPRNTAPLRPGGVAFSPSERVDDVPRIGAGMIGGDPLEPGVAVDLWPYPLQTGPLPEGVGRGTRVKFDARDPQSPKGVLPFAELIQDAIAGEDAGRLPPFVTLRAMRFAAVDASSGLTLIALPFEPSTEAAVQVEREVVRVTGGGRALCAALGGDYLGYLVTRDEYMVQQYEGGSSWFGRNVHPWLLAQLKPLLALPATTPAGKARFATLPPRTLAPVVTTLFDVEAPPLPTASHVVTTPELTLATFGVRWLRIGGSWFAARNNDSPPPTRAFRMLLRGANGKEVPAVLATGEEVTERCGWVTLFRELHGIGNRVVWRWQYFGPLIDSWRGCEVSFEVTSPVAGLKIVGSSKRQWQKIP